MTNLTETSREEMERVVIGRGGTCEVEFHISRPRTVLSWEFVSIDYDISFGWFRREIKTRKPKSSKSLKEIVSFMYFAVSLLGNMYPSQTVWISSSPGPFPDFNVECKTGNGPGVALMCPY